MCGPPSFTFLPAPSSLPAQNFSDRGDEKNESHDPLLARLLRNDRVILSGHQGFLTSEALSGIADITVGSLDAFMTGGRTGAAIPEKSLVNYEKMKARLAKRDWWRIAKLRAKLIVHLLGVGRKGAEARGEVGPEGISRRISSANLAPSGPGIAGLEGEDEPVKFKENQREYYDEAEE